MKSHARRQVVLSLRTCATQADDIGMHLYVENHRRKSSQVRYTETPDRLAAFIDDVGVDSEYLDVTLDVGHARVTGVDVDGFVAEFGDRLRVAHLHDTDGTADTYDVLADFQAVGERNGAAFKVFVLKSIADIKRCVAG